jgi:hypothetical protein
MPFILPIIRMLWGLVGSRVGILILAFGAGWAYSTIKCGVKIDAALEKQRILNEAALKVEEERWRASAAEIAQAATERAVEDQDLIRELNNKVDRFSKQEAPRDKNGKCLVDSMFVDIVRELSVPERRAPARHRRR